MEGVLPILSLSTICIISEELYDHLVGLGRKEYGNTHSENFLYVNLKMLRFSIVLGQISLEQNTEDFVYVFLLFQKQIQEI